MDLSLWTTLLLIVVVLYLLGKVARNFLKIALVILVVICLSHIEPFREVLSQALVTVGQLLARIGRGM